MTDWKIQRDPYYAPLFNVLGEAGIIDAGYFRDDATSDFDIAGSVNIKCTPLDYVRQRLHLPNPAIILATGSFNPIHDGHIEMMIRAKETLEENGYSCIGGFLAPDHDAYMRLKLGKAAIPIHKRIKLIQAAAQAYEWLDVDAWAGLFHVTSINFTDIVYRMRLYIKAHLGVEIPVFYVCGGDNARFAKSFVQQGHAVVISRPQHESNVAKAETECVALKRVFNNRENNILFGFNDNTNSSTKVRETFSYPTDVRELVLRVDDETPQDFVDILTKRFETVRLVNIVEQIGEFAAMHTQQTISLDPFIPAEINLGVSRLYDFFGIKKLNYTNRPGTPPLNEQIATIPAGSYDVFDDDIDTGGTMRFVTQQLLPDILINKQHTLTKYAACCEVLDVRDFMLDAPQGGLVIQDGATTKRVPYVYPFVCPYIRASIADPMEFSLEVWQANIAYFQERGDAKKAAECLKYYNMIVVYVQDHS